jgi:hypothetical protein
VQLLPYIGDRAAVDVRRTDVAQWREKMKADGKSARTVKRGLGAASVMWNWALELGHLPDDAHNPTEGVSRPSYKPDKGLYSTEEVVRLLTEAADFQSHSINVHRSFKRPARKNGKPVTVGLNPHLRDILGPLSTRGMASAPGMRPRWRRPGPPRATSCARSGSRAFKWP